MACSKVDRTGTPARERRVEGRIGQGQRRASGTRQGGQVTDTGERMACIASKTGQGQEGGVEWTNILLVGKQGNKLLREEGKGKKGGRRLLISISVAR